MILIFNLTYKGELSPGNVWQSLLKIRAGPIKSENYTFDPFYCQLLNVKTYYILIFYKKNQADFQYLPDITVNLFN